MQTGDQDRGSTRLGFALLAAYLGALAWVGIQEFLRCRALWNVSPSPLLWLFHWNPDSTPAVPFLILAPFAWRMRGRALPSHPIDSAPRSISIWGACLLAALTALFATWFTGRAFGDTPPAFHDEYSYLFQARTFLAGRLWFPSAAEPRLFDQMHVLNEGHFASRYFPGTGLWLAPFVALGHPYWAMWLAHALCAALVVMIGHELGCLRGGLFAGLLTAVSPGILLFSNLLLAHMPTLVGLLAFLWGFYRLKRTGLAVWALVAGCGLTFAMLCRPMTAAGVALPYGVYLLWSVCPWQRTKTPLKDDSGWETLPMARRWVCGLLLAAPLAGGFLAMASINREITGNAWLSPYQQYTDLHTPRHVYGFYNVSRGERHLGPRVLEHYDKWAEELTPALAAQNVRDRWLASWRWSLGLVPLAVVFWLVLASRELRSRLGLLLAAILSLHAAHIPYWYVGIMHWHYVFETAPLWLLLFGIVTERLFRTKWPCVIPGHAMLSRRDHRRPWMTWCWTAWIVTTVLVNGMSIDDVSIGPLPRGINELKFARNRYARFAAMVQQTVQPPAIVLVQSDPADRHLDYVTNTPALDATILFGRYLPASVSVERVRKLYPQRALYVFDARTSRLTRLSAR